MSGRIDQRLEELGITLPEAPVPSANYVPFRRSGNQVFIAGQISVTGDESAIGKVGAELSVEDGYAAARPCAAPDGRRCFGAGWQGGGAQVL